MSKKFVISKALGVLMVSLALFMAVGFAEQYASDNNIPYGVTQSYSSASAHQYSEKVTLETDRTVNIRSGPGTQHQQIGEAYPGISFFFTGTIENGFYQILYPSVNSDLGYVTAYVMESLAAVFPVSSQDVILSSSIGMVKVKQNATVYLDSALSISLRTAA